MPPDLRPLGDGDGHGEPKWSPGPWEQAGRLVWANCADPARRATVCAVSEPRASHFVQYAELRIGSPDAAEAYANARLIAAAPELYSMLAELVAWYADDIDGHDILHKASAALARARGETP